jgi:lactoylglutathione lyase
MYAILRAGMSTGFDHVGLSVDALDTAAEFYARAFGFEPQHEFELPGGIRGLMMRHPSGIRFELFEHPSSVAGLQGAMPDEALATRGYGHFALTVADLDGAYADALQAGAGERFAPRPSPEPGVRMAFVADPEGNLIELIEHP